VNSRQLWRNLLSPRWPADLDDTAAIRGTSIRTLYIQVGGDKVLVDDSRRITARARAAGVEVQLDIVPGAQHCFLRRALTRPAMSGT
jgi:acetyl esterase/lipase